MYPTYCKLKDFDLDKFLNANLMFISKLHMLGDVVPIPIVGCDGVAHFDEVNEYYYLKNLLMNGIIIFFGYHERFSINDDRVLCVDGEQKNEENEMEDSNYGFWVQIQTTADEPYILISPAILTDPDYKYNQNTVVSKVGWCGIFEERMKDFLQTFQSDYPQKVHMAMNI